MARCNYCGSSILFGGVTEGELQYCNERCHQQGYLLALADRIPKDLMAEHLAEVHQGDCPKCGGPGPIDVHTSYSVWSGRVARPELAKGVGWGVELLDCLLRAVLQHAAARSPVEVDSLCR